VKAKYLVSYILLSTFVILLLSTATNATEYREINTEVNATDVLKHIENGEDINLTKCRIVGELNLSDIKLEIVPNPYFEVRKAYEIKMLHDYMGKSIYVYTGIEPNEKLKVIESNITIKDSIFKNHLNFSNTLFKNSVSFENTSFSDVNFMRANFNNNTIFQEAKFNGVTIFRCTTFRDSADFSNAIFGNNATFMCANFAINTNFQNVQFGNYANFQFAYFVDPTNSIRGHFLGSPNFKNVHFGNYANFDGACFRNYGPLFYNISFGNFVSLRFVHFDHSPIFENAHFGDFVNFYSTNFEKPGSLDDDTLSFVQGLGFKNAQFGDYVYFTDVYFGRRIFFVGTEFGHHITFDGANFGQYANFRAAQFGNSADFSSANFANTISFEGPDTSENIITNFEACGIFMKYYKSQARYEDADNIYYNYREFSQERKSIVSLSKWMDILSFITCGYGVRPLNAFKFGIIIVFLFSFIYVNPISLHKNRSEKLSFCLSWNVSLDKSNKLIPFKLTLKNPGILHSDKIQEASLLDLFYYSICRFTFMNYENWYPIDNFRIFAIIEGILGWVTLGIFMATLTALMIRI
jgi:uncharacterized protein YjbI with pentapeptide repeats